MCTDVWASVWAIGCVLLAAILIGFLKRYCFKTLHSVFVCVHFGFTSLCTIYKYNLKGDAMQNHDVDVLANRNYFKDAYGMC